MKIHPHDVEKIAFRTLIDNFLWTIMQYGFNIVGVTYQWAMIVVFPDMLHEFS